MRTSEETEKIFRPDQGGQIVSAQESQGWVENCQGDETKGILGTGVITAKTQTCERAWYPENDMEMSMLGRRKIKRYGWNGGQGGPGQILKVHE